MVFRRNRCLNSKVCRNLSSSEDFERTNTGAEDKKMKNERDGSENSEKRRSKASTLTPTIQEISKKSSELRKFAQVSLDSQILTIFPNS